MGSREHRIFIRVEDIKAHPQEHAHTFDEMIACCLLDGSISSSLIDAHRAYGTMLTCDTCQRPHDVTRGACACGAWH